MCEYIHLKYDDIHIHVLNMTIGIERPMLIFFFIIIIIIFIIIAIIIIIIIIAGPNHAGAVVQVPAKGTSNFLMKI